MSVKRGWAAVGAATAATFTVVTSEMLPVGLLTPISRTLEVSEGTAGLSLTITGLVAAVSAPLVVPATRRLDRRTVMWALMLVLAAGNLLTAWAPHFGVVMAGRTLVGLGMAGVWTVAAPLAVRLVPERSVGAATALIFSGVAVASVLGVPAGTFLGDVIGWRAAFATAGVLAMAVAGVLAVLLPRLPIGRAVRLGEVIRLARERAVLTGLTIVLLLVSGHFAAYTFVRPVLEQVSGADAGLISTLLLAYGLAGVAGNFLGGAGAARSPRTTLLAIGTVLAATMLLVPGFGSSTTTATALLLLWGLAYGGVSVTTQVWLQAAAPGAREAVSALFVSLFNASIALGALAGGRLADLSGITSVMWTGGALALGAVAVTALSRPPKSSNSGPPGR